MLYLPHVPSAGLHCTPVTLMTAQKQMIRIDTAESEITPFVISHILLPFHKPGAYITHNATEPLGETLQEI